MLATGGTTLIEVQVPPSQGAETLQQLVQQVTLIPQVAP